MRILVVQTSILKCDNTHFIHAAIKNFINELASFGHEVKITGSILNSGEAEINYTTIDSKKVLEIQDFYNGYGRCVSYFLAFFKSIFKIGKFDFIYVFLPGNYPFILCLAALLLRRNYAIYLRVGQNAELFRYKFLYRHALFGFATGKKLNDLLSEFTSSEEVIPLLDFPQKFIYRYTCNENLINVIFVGRLTQLKGIDVLLKAFSASEIKTLPIKLHLVGDGDFKIKTDAESMPNVQLHGVISDRRELFGLLHQCDIFCLPSLDEGFPRVLYEAAFSKCVILTTFVGSIESMMLENENCLKLRCGSASDIIEKIKYLFNNDELIVKFKERAYKFYLNKYKSISDTHASQFNKTLLK